MRWYKFILHGLIKVITSLGSVYCVYVCIGLYRHVWCVCIHTQYMFVFMWLYAYIHVVNACACLYVYGGQRSISSVFSDWQLSTLFLRQCFSLTSSSFSLSDWLVSSWHPPVQTIDIEMVKYNHLIIFKCYKSPGGK